MWRETVKMTVNYGLIRNGMNLIISYHSQFDELQGTSKNDFVLPANIFCITHKVVVIMTFHILHITASFDERGIDHAIETTARKSCVLD